jgi:hypothetical protein
VPSSVVRSRDKELTKLGTWKSGQAILGSFKLWIELQNTNEDNYHNHEEIRTEIVLANEEQIETIENEEEKEDEGSDEEDSNEQELGTLTSEDQ